MPTAKPERCIASSRAAFPVNAWAPLKLPDVDGVDLCRRIRAQSGVPVIIATARTDVHERIRGLRAGADDYLVKPTDPTFHPAELLARDVVIDYRPGAGIRVAPHFYTTDAEVERLVHEVDDILATDAWRKHEGARRVVT